MASTAIALGAPLAVMVVPSSGSRAMSIGGPEPWAAPTFSPMNSIGASSRSPSPITTVPSISRLLSAARIASTAAWSAAFSSPRPISFDAATAAASVTRTISRTRTRSRTWLALTIFRVTLLVWTWRRIGDAHDKVEAGGGAGSARLGDRGGGGRAGDGGRAHGPLRRGVPAGRGAALPARRGWRRDHRLRPPRGAGPGPPALAGRA